MAAVRERVERRVDVVKVMASGGMATTGSDVFVPQFLIEELRLLVEQAHAAGLPVTAHAHSAAAVDQGVAAGVEGIEHASSRATEEQLGAWPRAVSRCALRLVGSIPNRWQLCGRRSALPAGLRRCRPLRQSLTSKSACRLCDGDNFGVRLISGDDAGIGPDKAHGRYAEAVIELEQATDTMPALVAASSDAAAAIGLGRSKGRLRRGYDADLLVVGGDLAADLTALRDVRQVVLRGVPVSPRSGQS